MKNKPLQANNIRLWQRLLLVGLTGTIPLFIVSLILIKITYSDSIYFAVQEQRGIAFQRPLEQLLFLVPRYEAAARQEASGGVGATNEVTGLRQQIDMEMDLVATNYNGTLGRALKFTNRELARRGRDTGRLSTLQACWANLQKASPADSSLAKAGNDLVASLRTMIAHASDLSNLVLDDELDSYYLADISTSILPQTQKRLGDAILQGNDRARRGESEMSKTRAAVMSELLRQDDINRILNDARTALRENENYYGGSPSLQTNLPAAVERFRTASSAFIGVLDSVAAGETVSPGDYETAGWRAHAECFHLWQTCTDELDHLLAIRIHVIEARRLQCWLIILGTLVAAAMAMGIIIRHLLAAHEAQTIAAADALRSRETQLRAIGDNLPDGMVYRIMRDHDGTMRFLHVSAGIERLNGLAAEAVLANSTLFFNQIMPEDQPRLLAARQNSLANKTKFQVVIRIRRPDGEVRWVQMSSMPQRLPDGRFVWDGIETDVTEQRRAVEALTLLRSLIDRTNDAIEVIDPETGKFLDVNEQASRLHGYSPEEYKSLLVTDIDPAYGNAGPEAWNIQVLKLQQAGFLVFEGQHRRKDGSVFPVEINATYIQLDRDYVLAVVRDITERKRAEQRISHLNRVYAVLSEINHTIARERDLQAMLQAACRIAVEKGEFRMAWIGILDEVSGQFKPVAWAGVMDGYLTAVKINHQDQGCATDPATRVLHIGDHAICNNIEQDSLYAPWRQEALQRGYRSSGGFPLKVEGRIAGVFSLYAGEPGYFNPEELKLLDELAMDLGFGLEFHRQEARRKEAEITLKQSEERFSRIFNTSPVAISLTRFSDGTMLDVNESFLRMSGFTREEVIGRSVAELEIYADPNTRTIIREHLKQHGHLHGHAQCFRTKHGEIRERILWLELITIGGEACALTLALDVTEQKRAEQKQRQLEERFSLIFKKSPIPITLHQFPGGTIIDANESFLQMAGFTLAEVAGRTPLELGIYPDPSKRPVIIGHLERDGHLHGHEQAFRTKSGQVRITLLWIEILKICGEKFHLAMSMDITEQKQAEQKQKQLEEQLRQTQKLEALGTLAGGIAHDFNNILGAIISFTELSRLDNPDNAELQDNLGEVLKASNRATNLVRQILSFSRQQKHERKHLQVGPVIREALQLLRATLPATIEIQQSLGDDLPDVLANPTQIHQVIMNLCTNAGHAMKGSQGQLRVKLDTVAVNNAESRPHVELKGGNYVRLTVSDTGHGMDDKTLKRVFEPFFTTKGPGEGTGLGLSVVHGIVKEHEGIIGVESALGAGTTFTIYLPAGEVTTSLETGNGPKIPMGNGERILFVDDEIMLGEVARKIIRKLGYVPVVFHRPDEAWEALQKEPAAFDVLISDLTMPVMTGVELARRALTVRPNLPVILTSGSSGTSTMASAREIGIREMVSKPLDYQTLAMALNKVLHPPIKLK